MLPSNDWRLEACERSEARWTLPTPMHTGHGSPARSPTSAASIYSLPTLPCRRGVRVNAVSPGPIYFEGGFWADVEKEDPETFDFVSKLAALRRMGTDVEVARLVTFLASPAAGYITGANVRIDGGTVKAVNF